MKKFDFKTTEYSSLSNSQLKRLCDYELRQYLLRSAEKDSRGNIWCPLKGRYYPEDKIHVAHFFDRGVMNTRYSIENCHLISEASNVWDAQVQEEGWKSKHHKEYEEYLKNTLNFKKLLVESKVMRIFARQEYINLIEDFRKNE